MDATVLPRTREMLMRSGDDLPFPHENSTADNMARAEIRARAGR